MMTDKKRQIVEVTWSDFGDAELLKARQDGSCMIDFDYAKVKARFDEKVAAALKGGWTRLGPIWWKNNFPHQHMICGGGVVGALSESEPRSRT